MMRGAALLLLALVACRGDRTPGPRPVADHAPDRDAGLVDAPPSVIAATDAAAPSMPTPSGKRADAPRRPLKIEALDRAQDVGADADAEARAAAEARAGEYRDRVLGVGPDPFADAAPRRSTLDGATEVRGDSTTTRP